MKKPMHVKNTISFRGPFCLVDQLIPTSLFPLIHPPRFAREQCHRSTLVLGGTGLGELEGDTTASESAVDLRVGVESVVNATTLLLVKDDLQQLAAILLGAQTLADDLDGVYEVSQDGVVDGSQSARTGALLLLGVAGAGRALGAGEDAARGQDEDVAVRELLLELTGQAAGYVLGTVLWVNHVGTEITYRC
jgi:hypothetical protein